MFGPLSHFYIPNSVTQEISVMVHATQHVIVLQFFYFIILFTFPLHGFFLLVTVVIIFFGKL